jgi:hypothetical protein
MKISALLISAATVTVARVRHLICPTGAYGHFASSALGENISLFQK